MKPLAAVAAVPRGAPRRARGFTLVDCLAACAVSAVAATVALPSLQAQMLQNGRLDAVALLTRVHAAQEQHRSLYGRYAADAAAIGLATARSEQGHYRLELVATGAESYRARAVAVGRQARDTRCPALTLAVDRGFVAQPTPAEGCAR